MQVAPRGTGRGKAAAAVPDALKSVFGVFDDDDDGRSNLRASLRIGAGLMAGDKTGDKEDKSDEEDKEDKEDTTNEKAGDKEEKKPKGHHLYKPAPTITEDEEWQTGTMETHLRDGKFGFITQDNGEDHIFVLPNSCQSKPFNGRLPEIGYRVSYRAVIDAKSGKVRAEYVQPEAMLHRRARTPPRVKLGQTEVMVMAEKMKRFEEKQQQAALREEREKEEQLRHQHASSWMASTGMVKRSRLQVDPLGIRKTAEQESNEKMEERLKEQQQIDEIDDEWGDVAEQLEDQEASKLKARAEALKKKEESKRQELQAAFVRDRPLRRFRERDEYEPEPPEPPEPVKDESSEEDQRRRRPSRSRWPEEDRHPRQSQMAPREHRRQRDDRNEPYDREWSEDDRYTRRRRMAPSEERWRHRRSRSRCSRSRRSRSRRRQAEDRDEPSTRRSRMAPSEERWRDRPARYSISRWPRKQDLDDQLSDESDRNTMGREERSRIAPSEERRYQRPSGSGQSGKRRYEERGDLPDEYDGYARRSRRAPSEETWR